MRRGYQFSIDSLGLVLDGVVDYVAYPAPPTVPIVSSYGDVAAALEVRT